MYEKYYAFTEKPFSLTPDPKFLFRSETHAGVVNTASGSLDLPRATWSAPPLGTCLRRRGSVAVALGLSILIGSAAAGLGYLVSQGYRLTVTDRFQLVAVQRPVDPPTASANIESSRP